ncbi:conserved hypothetical protein [Isorropodon fossajaponicum endosymbiont JTNG4]|uniref:hypothetical protein n=1 Tax=Isorropodon fossajaponicum symbiont TaxID=883811 RepID=UPI0019156F18|nr:hypothetical protein [Isorropodon fossajaponicum symbiont]BBB23862.1 conserved hypothetical protein [Isorropodon fossajaponicum endosymbiont JTNG4]
MENNKKASNTVQSKTGQRNNADNTTLELNGNNTKDQLDIDDKPPKQDELLIELASKKCTFFHDDQKEAYAKVKIGSHIEIWNISSPEFNDWLAHQFWIKNGQGVKKSSYESALLTLRGMAIFEGKTEEVHLRVAQINDMIYIDICNKNWEVIEINKKGWRVVNNPPINFSRSKNMKPLHTPKIKNGGINLLLKHLNINTDDLPLVVGWLLMGMQAGSGALPILIFQGPTGCGKTTASKMLREIIDPNSADLLSKPKTEDMRVIGVRNHVLAFDNLSGIHSNYSDALCKISTGDNQTIRRLHTTNDEFTISIKKPILLNGIDEITSRNDLLSRSIRIELKKIKLFKPESQVWADFIKDVPSILSALLDGTSCALANHNKIRIKEITRMGDFCRWSTAAGKAFSWEKDIFINQYKRNIAQSYIDSINSSNFATAVVDMINKKPDFKGTPAELLMSLNFNSQVKIELSAKGVVNKVLRCQDALEVFGIEIDKYKDRTNRTLITIKTNEEYCQQSGISDEWLKEYNS